MPARKRESGRIKEQRHLLYSAVPFSLIQAHSSASANIRATAMRFHNLVPVNAAENSHGSIGAASCSSAATDFEEGEKGFGDDVAVDPDGNEYVTDASGSKIWKVGVNGEFLYTIRSPLFAQKEWYNRFVGLNGIVYHPNGYLLVIHTFSGNLFKIEIGEEDKVKLVNVIGGSLRFGDGLDLVSSTKLVVAELLESSDDWETAGVAGKFSGATHRLVTAATVKDGKVYLNHMFC